ncbi:unnamed protein product [Diatraea saccharalis]|uniref:Uncharacterized protein n=1 Tax=Diatraea saccharalis TaxID=40085 RepID=A0A9N9QZI0_9NEOP|nr:unnamed protein product [Diatraea saccharalis]
MTVNMIRYCAVTVILLISNCDGFRRAFDHDLYKNVLDPEICQKQLDILSNTNLGLLFLDASGKIPNGIASSNLNDLGDYYQCLGIDTHVNGTNIKGKYSAVLIPLNQEIQIPQLPPIPEIPELPEIPGLPNITLPPLPTELIKNHQDYSNLQRWAQIMAVGDDRVVVEKQDVNTRIFPMFIAAQGRAMLGICVPRVCTSTETVNYFQSRIPFLNFTFIEHYYRLPDDRPFAPADYVAFVIFSIIGVLTISSTSYDLYNVFGVKRRPNKMFTSFSVFTNTKRFLTFNSSPGALECVDGIRAISMMWVVVGHTYSMTLLGFVHNIQEVLGWMRLFTSTWVNSAPLTVDTFFLLSGILAVYSTIGKIGKRRFVRTVHLFYINRLLRMFPLLAIVILLQASVFNYVSDGPFWQNMAHATENCRRYWWSALLYVQNYVNPLETCLAHTWYLSVDTQLYIFSPLILFWLFGSRKFAWAALCCILLLSLVSSSAYSFIHDFSAALVQPNRIAEFADYMQTYYINTLARAPPFFVGMIYGYILHLYRGKKVKISRGVVTALFCMAFALMSFCVFSIYPVMQLDWTYQTFDNFLNAYMRSLWSLSLGWIIFACVHGYGGPVNWFLSLSMWKLPARLSYAMYLIHLPIIMIANSSWTQTYFFRNGHVLYRFVSDLTLTFIAAFILCILIDAPFSTLQKLLMGGGRARPQANNMKPESQPSIVEKTTL